MIVLLFMWSSAYADVICSGNGLEVVINTSSSISAQIRLNGNLIADTSDVSDLSAFDIHFVGNFGRSSFDLIVQDSGAGRIKFDNYSGLRSVKLSCMQN